MPLVYPPACASPERRGASSSAKTDLHRAEALFREANSHLHPGRDDLAEACLREAIRVAPEAAAPHANLGFVLERRGDDAAAEACYRRSLQLRDDAQVHCNLGALLARQRRFEAARRVYERAIALDPIAASTWSNLGALHACTKHEAEAERCLRVALSIDPDHVNAAFNLSYLLLRQGRFDEGWQRLDARDWYHVLERRIECPRWRGESLLGKSLLIGFEAGHGDMIQLCRYASVLKARGAARIHLMCHSALKPLFAGIPEVDAVLAADEPMPAFGCDFWTPPLSIPRYCGTRLDSIPASLPYLRAPSDRVTRWSSQVPADGLRVGLVWKGNPRFENDSERSLPSLSVLAPLWSVGGAHFISLQKGAGEDEARRSTALPIIDLGSRVDDFADTAAIIANLDLVISVDTAVAHLAGALATPCWILLPEYKTDWRWLAGRTDSPWYPQVVRLFRQANSGDWTDVVAALADALSRVVVPRRMQPE